MIDRTHPLPITRQAQIVNISRGSVHHESEPISDADLRLMRRIDELHLELPFAVARMLRDLLRAEGFVVGRKHMTTLMRRMGITALYRKPNTSKRAPGAHDLALPVAHAGDHALEPRLGDGHQLHPDGARVRLPGGQSSTGTAARCWRGGCRSRWTRRSAPKRSKKRSPGTASPRSSTPIRAASLGSRSRRNRFEW